MATIASGLVGGLLGAVAVAALTTVRGNDPALSAVVWAKYLGDGDPAHYETQGRVVTLAYGAVAGVLFVAVAGAFSLGVADLGSAALWAVGWSLVLFAIAVGFWTRLLVGDRPDTRELAETGTVHLAFGVVLGLVVGLVPGV